MDGADAGLRVEITTDADRAEARLHGPLDSATRNRLEAVLGQLIRAGHRRIVLDLAGVDVLTAACLAVLDRADTDLRAAGGCLVLTRAPRIVRRALAVTGLDATLTLE